MDELKILTLKEARPKKEYTSYYSTYIISYDTQMKLECYKADQEFPKDWKEVGEERRE